MRKKRMIWKNMKKEHTKFDPVPFKESNKILINPCRGWYEIYTFDVEKRIVKEELKWSLRQEETIALVLLDLGKFQRQSLSKEAIENIECILEFFWEYDRDVILRPVYDRMGNAKEREPRNFSLILEHLRQIGEVLRKKTHTVFLFQGLLVGNWGEMHGSSYLEAEKMREMWRALHAFLTDDIFHSVRTPMQWRILVEQENYQKGEFQNLGIFDDGIFGSTTHLGTFGTMTKEAAGWENAWNRKEEMDFLDIIHRKIPFGGEVVAEETVGIPDGRLGMEEKDVLAELKKLHVSYLNCTYDKRLLDQWKQKTCKKGGIWENSSLYDYVESHLGYRFFVKKVEIQQLHFRKAKISITICNRGFATICQETELHLNVANEDGKKKYRFSYDMRTLQGGKEEVVSITQKFEKGNLFLELKRKKDGRTIFFANEDKEYTDGLYIGRLY